MGRNIVSKKAARSIKKRQARNQRVLLGEATTKVIFDGSEPKGRIGNPQGIRVHTDPGVGNRGGMRKEK